MAFLGEESVRAAAASECAGEQGRFWEYHDALFTHTAGRGSGAFTTPNLKRYATDVGLDTAAFNGCVDSGRYDEWVRGETESGRQQGVSRTPSLFINGQLQTSVPASFDDLRSLILSRLAAKG